MFSWDKWCDVVYVNLLLLRKYSAEGRVRGGTQLRGGMGGGEREPVRVPLPSVSMSLKMLRASATAAADAASALAQTELIISTSASTAASLGEAPRCAGRQLDGRDSWWLPGGWNRYFTFGKANKLLVRKKMCFLVVSRLFPRGFLVAREICTAAEAILRAGQKPASVLRESIGSCCPAGNIADECGADPAADDSTSHEALTLGKARSEHSGMGRTCRHRASQT